MADEIAAQDTRIETELEPILRRLRSIASKCSSCS
jgi:hypothetical protein